MATLQDRRGQLYGTRDLGFTPKKERSFFGALTSGLGHLSNLLYSVSDRGRAASAAERARQARLEEERDYRRREATRDEAALQEFMAATGRVGTQKQRLQTNPSALDMFGSQPRELLPDPRTGVSELGGVPRIQADYLGSPNEFISPEMLQGIQRDAMLPDIPRTAVPGTGQFEEDIGASATGVEPEIPETPQIPRLPGVGIADRGRAADEFNMRQMALDDLAPITTTAKQEYSGMQDLSRLPVFAQQAVYDAIRPQTEEEGLKIRNLRRKEELDNIRIQTAKFDFQEKVDPRDRIEIRNNQVYSLNPKTGEVNHVSDLSGFELVADLKNEDARATFMSQMLGIPINMARNMVIGGLTLKDALEQQTIDSYKNDRTSPLSQARARIEAELNEIPEINYREGVGGWLGDRFQTAIINSFAGAVGADFLLADESQEAKDALETFSLDVVLKLASTLEGRPNVFSQEKIQASLPNLNESMSDNQALSKYKSLMNTIISPLSAHWEAKYNRAVSVGNLDAADEAIAEYERVFSAQHQLATIIDVFEMGDEFRTENIYKKRPNQGAGAALRGSQPFRDDYDRFYREFGN